MEQRGTRGLAGDRDQKNCTYPSLPSSSHFLRGKPTPQPPSTEPVPPSFTPTPFSAFLFAPWRCPGYWMSAALLCIRMHGRSTPDNQIPAFCPFYDGNRYIYRYLCRVCIYVIHGGPHPAAPAAGQSWDGADWCGLGCGFGDEGKRCVDGED